MQGVSISEGMGKWPGRRLEWWPGLCLEDLDEKLGLYPKSFGESLMDLMQGNDTMHVRNIIL